MKRVVELIKIAWAGFKAHFAWVFTIVLIIGILDLFGLGGVGDFGVGFVTAVLLGAGFVIYKIINSF